MPSGEHPNSRANLTPFKSGDGWNGCRHGGTKLGQTWRMWLSKLLEEDEDGNPKYTTEHIREIAEAPDDDATVSPSKRMAAQRLLEGLESGKDGREALSLMLDRTEGKPHQSMTLDGSLDRDPAHELTQDSLRRIREATAN